MISSRAIADKAMSAGPIKVAIIDPRKWMIRKPAIAVNIGTARAEVFPYTF